MNEIDNWSTSLDLNLLVALHWLLEEGSVTRAAQRLGVGQPAASHALARLREAFDDPLLVRSGRSMVPTPRGAAVREPLRRLLADADRLVRHDSGFDPATTSRSFTVTCPDLLAPLLPRLVARLRADAPRARLSVNGRGADEHAALGDGRSDLLLAPAPADGAGLRQRGLGRVHWGIVARRGHPALRKDGRLRARAWTDCAHIVVQSGSTSRSIVGDAIARAGLERRIGLVVPTFLAALVSVAETDLFFAAPREFVRPLVGRLSLRVAPPPIAIPPVPVAATWHERFDADPAHRFLRDRVVDEVGSAIRAS